MLGGGRVCASVCACDTVLNVCVHVAVVVVVLVRCRYKVVEVGDRVQALYQGDGNTYPACVGA